MDNNPKIPMIMYLYLHTKIVENSSNGLIAYRDAVSYLHEWRIPKELRVIIIKEMETLGLLKRVNRDVIELNRPKIDFSNMNNIYEMVGIRYN